MEMDMKALLRQVAEGKDLTEAQAEAAMALMMSGEATPAQVAAFLMALRIKGETVAEITGAARVMRERATRIYHSRPMVVDTCGTGGDGSHTFNISTTAAFVVAGAGVAVAKHGNRAATSLTGSADVLEALGVNLDLTPAQVGRCIDEAGIGFLYAPALHTSMKHVAPVRREIGLRNIFNLLGPLTNPAMAQAQLMGVYDPNLTEPLARVLGNLGVQHALVVHGTDGMDEISISAPTVISEMRDGFVQTYRVVPEDVGLSRAPREYIRGGTKEENARITEAVLSGEPGPRRDVVLLNAAAALLAADRVRTLREGVELAAQSIDSGEARRALERLRELTHRLRAESA
ncbi:anthranilate phosphoribosyltransferase [Symbiobacterium terraclitae]|uniref:Anthranilate phosphoribosyltransferase n=2 Tax=Symbiobacterium terraclitae TaxID=557451 RepID=A0ABS4JUR0_9FIRM|nr:anthranilate phosphoribosyltransferase [Symbiobacterium terraclitae]